MRLRGVCLAICCGLALAVQAMPVTVSDKGVAIDAGSLGPLQLDPPVLMDAANKESRPIEQKMDGGRALFTYPGGVQLALAPRDGGVTLTFLTDPAGFTRFRFDVLLPFTLAQGGTWRMDIADAKAFPESAADNPFLFQGQAGSFTVIGLQGKGVTFTTPPYTYHQLQDNRKWNWKIFQWLAFTPLLANVKDYTLGIADADRGDGRCDLDAG